MTSDAISTPMTCRGRRGEKIGAVTFAASDVQNTLYRRLGPPRRRSDEDAHRAADRVQLGTNRSPVHGNSGLFSIP